LEVFAFHILRLFAIYKGTRKSRDVCVAAILNVAYTLPPFWLDEAVAIPYKMKQWTTNDQVSQKWSLRIQGRTPLPNGV